VDVTPSAADRWLLRPVELEGRLTDCRLAAGLVRDIGPNLVAEPDERLMDAYGGALIPGLADHHLHLRALAAARRSVDLAGDDLPGPDRAAELAPNGDGWLRIVGVGSDVTRSDLDRRWPHGPVRVQHRSGALWTLNSAALSRISGPTSIQERASGQFWRPGPRLRHLLGDHAGNRRSRRADQADHRVTRLWVDPPH
jgi:predicted amidohydrolase YtcJ